MIILGVDPGFASLGLAAVELTLQTCAPLAAWVVHTEPSARKQAVRASEDNVRRCGELATALEAAVTRWSPVALAAETMSWPRNAGSAAKVALCWGVLVAVAHRHGLPLVQASPQDVKRALLGTKTASKEEMIAEVERRWPGLELSTQATLQEHAADAVAVVVACLDSPVLVTAPDVGPRCTCGCTWVEHELHVNHEWETYAGACLSCLCEQFTLAALDPAGPSGPLNNMGAAATCSQSQRVQPGEVDTSAALRVSPLALARLRAGLTQAQLAHRAQRSVTMISAAERGALSRPLARRLAKVLKVPVSSLLPGGEP